MRQSLPRRRAQAPLLVGLCVFALALAPLGQQQASGQAKEKDGKSVTFTSNDGVELAGTLYAGAGGKREASVLLLHNVDTKKGGSSGEDGWATLAKALQADGYTVLSFDFRGFGDSKNVLKDTFWNVRHRHNQLVKPGKSRDTIDHKDFKSAQYIPYLTYDIAAARAFLDRQNDQGVGNTSNLIVIGAGQGASLGALWMVNECRRRRDTQSNPLLLPMLSDQSEGKDVACAIWLSMSRHAPMSARLNTWITETGKENKIPMVFLYGKRDTSSANIALGLERLVKQSSSKEKSLSYAHGVADSKLAGNKLLDKRMIDNIRKYLDEVMEARGNKERIERNVEKSRYYYSALRKGLAPQLNKLAGEKAPPVNVSLFLPM